MNRTSVISLALALLIYVAYATGYHEMTIPANAENGQTVMTRIGYLSWSRDQETARNIAKFAVRNAFAKLNFSDFTSKQLRLISIKDPPYVILTHSTIFDKVSILSR